MSVMTPNSTRGAVATFSTAPARPVAATPPVSEQAARLLAVLGVAGIALIHVLDAANTFQGTRYIFWMYVAIIAGAIPISVLLMQWSSPLAWVGPALLSVGPLVGYLLTRTVGLPGDSADIGNWLDTLGIASLFVEISVLVLSLARLRARGASR
jgi:hypothetical protein